MTKAWKGNILFLSDDLYKWSFAIYFILFIFLHVSEIIICNNIWIPLQRLITCAECVQLIVQFMCELWLTGCSILCLVNRVTHTLITSGRDVLVTPSCGPEANYNPAFPLFLFHSLLFIPFYIRLTTKHCFQNGSLLSRDYLSPSLHIPRGMTSLPIRVCGYFCTFISNLWLYYLA